LLGRIGEWEPARPDTHNLLLDVIEQSTTGVAAIELTSYYNGVYLAQVTMEDGAEFDCRPTMRWCCPSCSTCLLKSRRRFSTRPPCG